MEYLKTMLTTIVVVDSIIFTLIAIWLVGPALSSRDLIQGENILSSMKSLSLKMYRAFLILFFFVVISGIICGVWLYNL